MARDLSNRRLHVVRMLGQIVDDDVEPSSQEFHKKVGGAGLRVERMVDEKKLSSRHRCYRSSWRCAAPRSHGMPAGSPQVISAVCGIAGYVGPKDAISVVIDQLKRLEYRGYDSAGAAWLGQGALHV